MQCKGLSHFNNKNNCVFVLFMFETLINCLLTMSLILNKMGPVLFTIQQYGNIAPRQGVFQKKVGSVYLSELVTAILKHLKTISYCTCNTLLWGRFTVTERELVYLCQLVGGHCNLEF